MRARDRVSCPAADAGVHRLLSPRPAAVPGGGETLAAAQSIASAMLGGSSAGSTRGECGGLRAGGRSAGRGADAQHAERDMRGVQRGKLVPLAVGVPDALARVNSPRRNNGVAARER